MFRLPKPAASPTWSGALPQQIVKLGHQVTVYLPLYARVRARLESQLAGADPTYAARSITIPFRHYNRFAGIVDGGVRDGVQFYFVDCR